ncbi:MAG: hypothetical protein JNL12_10960 [Planctomycetes bacterium]|nr:hypothetical protein [Planctomycetota bacterium]
MLAHAEPFQRAMFAAGTPPALVNRPPTTKSPFGMVVVVRTLVNWLEPVRPEPNDEY